MPPENRPRFDFGALRSEMSLTLHTPEASRLWRGLTRNPDKPHHISLYEYISVTNLMKHGAQHDDPFSDWWMVRLEKKIREIEAQLKAFREEADGLLAQIPPTLSIGDNANVQPVKVPLFIGSPLGFAAIYLVADFDTLVRHLKLLHHIARMDRRTMLRRIGDGAHAVRGLFALAMQYRFSGVTREDFRAQNAAWGAAVEKFGHPPKGIISGDVRSRFAPQRRATGNARAAGDEEIDASGAGDAAAPADDMSVESAPEGEPAVEAEPAAP